MLNTSFPNQSTSPTDDNQLTFASVYLQHDVTRVLWLVVPPVLLVLGCYGNVMTIVMMRAMRASESTGCLSVYFTALAVSDLFLLGSNVLWYWPEMALDAPLFYFHELSCTVPFFVSCVSSITSAWFLVALACQRMIAVILPHRVEVLCTAKKGEIITAVIAITSCVSNVHLFLNFHVQYVEQGYPSCVARDRDLAGMFSFLHLCFASAIPFVVLIVANLVLIRGAVQSVKVSGQLAGHDRGTQTSTRLGNVSSVTRTLILTSAAFLLLTLPVCSLSSYLELIGYYEGAVDDEYLNLRLALADTVCVLLWMTNSAINFYIYVLSGRKFRQEATRYIPKCS